jgi:putative membrane-bound dehydrogenase-like protein
MTYGSSTLERRRATAMAFALWLVLGVAAEVRAQVSPDETLKSFELADGLEATVWATEPMLVNPTNIDVDSRGRVWVLEGANYRKSVTRPEGDRIVILEDTDDDGKADTQKVFAQDPKLASPLGIAVLGDKVYVSQSPDVWVYTIDASGDKPAGKPELWMTGFEGVNHDHGVHAFVFGPDGRLYFNAGNDGCSARSPFKWGRDGSPVVDVLGSHVPRGPQWRGAPRAKGTIGYDQGMAFRCNPDGSRFEVVGHNFRNNYELAVDSFGTVWQSDNDDDGNEGARINYVMEGGNFGFHNPITGHDWQRDRPAFPDQTRQEAHWHQRWPGVVPNMLNTGQGSPTGIVVYEGELLPEKFHGALIHCEPGHNIVRAYVPKRTAQVPVKKFDEPDALKGPDREGAGYTAEVVNVLKGKDSWFRPSDVCVAPDGSLLVADWYDPGVGGHQTGDKPHGQGNTLRGRIYRIAREGHKPSPPKLDLASVDGQIAALKSPNMATRFLAHRRLPGLPNAEPALAKVFARDPNPRNRARAMWLLARTGNGPAYVTEALKDSNVDLRVAGLRAARVAGMDIAAVANGLLTDPSPGVLREVALAMNYHPAQKAVPILVKLANVFDGEDRWYLEAIGIGATGMEDALLAAWEKDGTNKDGKAGELIRWRLKMEPPAPSALEAGVQVVPGWWAVGPFDGSVKDPLGADFGPDAHPAAINPAATLSGVDGKAVKWERIATTAYEGPIAGLRWVDFNAFCADRGFRTDAVIGYFATRIDSPVGQPATLLIGSNDNCRVWLNGREVLNVKRGRALRFPDDSLDVTLNGGPNVLLVKLRNHLTASGLIVAVKAAQQKVAFSEAAPGASGEVVAAINGAKSPAHAHEGPVTKDGSPLPPVDELAKLTGDPKAGAAVFANAGGANCISCHEVGDRGQMLGPPLTTIGQKLSKAQLYEAILKPNAGILMGYENWVVRTKAGQTVSGLKTAETPETVTIKDAGGKYHDIPAGDVARQVKQKISLMPENLSQAMTKQELVDLVEYLATLKNK